MSLSAPRRPGRTPRHASWACLALGLALSLPPVPAGAGRDPQGDEQESAPSGTQDPEARKPEAEKDQKPTEPGPPAKPRATPRPAGRPAPPAAPAATPSRAVTAAPAATPAPAAPLRFTDEDLERFHKRPPEAGEPGEDEAGDEGAAETPAIPAGTAPSATAPSAGAPAAPPMKKAAPRPTPGAAQPPGADPLMAFKERDKRQAMRAEQLKSLRDRVARIQARLELLRAKRLAIVNPFYPMPEGGGEERKRDSALKPKEMLELVDKEIQDAEAELAEAREDLIDFETRFAAELGAP
jgi:hypothetical protein